MKLLGAGDHHAGFTPALHEEEKDREESPVLRRLCFLEQHLDLDPKCAAGFLLVLWQLGQSDLIPDAGEVEVGLPVLKGLRDARRGLLRTGFDLLGPERQVGLEPVDRLLAPAGPGRLIKRRWRFRLVVGPERRRVASNSASVWPLTSFMAKYGRRSANDPSS